MSSIGAYDSAYYITSGTAAGACLGMGLAYGGINNLEYFVDLIHSFHPALKEEEELEHHWLECDDDDCPCESEYLTSFQAKYWNVKFMICLGKPIITIAGAGIGAVAGAVYGVYISILTQND